MSENKVSIILGAGALGMSVMEALVSQNRPVKMVSSTGSAKVRKGVEITSANALDFSSLSKAVKGADKIYNCAAPHYTEWDTKFIPMMENIIKVAENTQATLIHGDNLYMYGLVDKAISEDLPHKAAGKKGIIRANIQKMIIDAHKTNKIKSVVGSSSSFYGPYVNQAVAGKDVFFAAIYGKSAPVLGNIDMPHTFTYVKDFAKALIMLSDSEKALGGVWHVPAAPAVSTREFISMIYKKAGNEPKFRIATRQMVSIFGIFSKNMRELKETMYMYENPVIVSSEKFSREFGDISTSHLDGIGNTLEWYRSN